MSRWALFDIACIGTSLTYQGVGGWQENLRNRLRLLTPRPVRTYDFGKSAATTVNAPSISTPARMRPQVALIEYAMNDAITANSISVATFQTNLGNMVDAYQDEMPGSSIFLMTMNPTIDAAAAATPNLSLYYQAVRDVATAKSVGLIDNYPEWGTPTSGDIPDGVHPTPEIAAEVLVPNIIEALTPLL